jgi:hypothetical protein
MVSHDIHNVLGSISPEHEAYNRDSIQVRRSKDLAGPVSSNFRSGRLTNFEKDAIKGFVDEGETCETIAYALERRASVVQRFIKTLPPEAFPATPEIEVVEPEPEPDLPEEEEGPWLKVHDLLLALSTANEPYAIKVLLDAAIDVVIEQLGKENDGCED